MCFSIPFCLLIDDLQKRNLILLYLFGLWIFSIFSIVSYIPNTSWFMSIHVLPGGWHVYALLPSPLFCVWLEGNRGYFKDYWDVMWLYLLQFFFLHTLKTENKSRWNKIEIKLKSWVHIILKKIIREMFDRKNNKWECSF